MRVLVLCSLLLAGCVASDYVKSYHMHRVLSAKAENAQQVAFLHNLQHRYQDLVFLQMPSLTMPTEVVVPPTDLQNVMQALTSAGISVTVQTTDLQEDIDAEMKEIVDNKLKNQRAGPSLKNGRFSPAHNTYYTLDEVNQIMENFAAAYPELVSMKQLPNLSEMEERPIYYLEMGNRSDTSEVIIIEGLAHAREWIVTASIIFSIDATLLSYMAGDPTAQAALHRFTFVIIPVLNPDGYVYSWTNDRLWRKNRKFISNQCTGVDLNRNFDVDFGGVGASANCRDITYRGPGPFSEAESQNVATLFAQLKSRVVGYLSVHSYTQLLLYPWGYVNSNFVPNPPSNLDELIRVGQLMKAALESNGQTYILGTAYGALGYAASGAAEDWALQEKPGIYAYCYELRPRTQAEGGFIISPSNIIPTGEELVRSVLVLAQSI